MDSIGKYQLKQEIGRGAYATVYRAIHTTLLNEVALKLLNPTLTRDEHGRQRFLQEAQVAATLDHPNIAHILDLDEHDGQVFFTMEFFAGGDLAHWLKAKGGQARREDTLRILEQVSAALDYAHSKNILHRDVKPGNILIDDTGGAHLGDFGLVRVMNSPHLTQLGNVVGTALYMAPEQAEGHELNGYADQYSLGVVAYELLTGQPPFTGDSATAISLMHINKTPPLPSGLNTDLGPEVDEVLLKVLAKDPAGRYPNCSTFIRTLRAGFEAATLRRFRELTEQARSLLTAGKFSDARQQLEAAAKLLPDRLELANTLAELDQMRQQAEQIEQMNHDWQQALQKAQAVLDLYPDYPDPQAIFVELGLRKMPRTPLRATLRQIGVGLLAGLLAAGAILFGIFQWWIAR